MNSRTQRGDIALIAAIVFGGFAVVGIALGLYIQFESRFNAGSEQILNRRDSNERVSGAPDKQPSTQRNQDRPNTEATGSGSNFKTGDINDDGVTDSTDELMVQLSKGCGSGEPCWDEVVGKTLSGDNPIYARDLDLNGDGTITDADLSIFD